jgi:hypothetical protein
MKARDFLKAWKHVIFWHDVNTNHFSCAWLYFESLIMFYLSSMFWQWKMMESYIYVKVMQMRLTTTLNRESMWYEIYGLMELVSKTPIGWMMFWLYLNNVIYSLILLLNNEHIYLYFLAWYICVWLCIIQFYTCKIPKLHFIWLWCE